MEDIWYWLIPAFILGLIIWFFLIFTNPFIMTITLCHGLLLLTVTEFFNIEKNKLWKN